jgi:hypothetical protein
MVKEFIRVSPEVAPLFPLTSLPLYFLFGISRLAAHMTNIFYLVLLLSGVYLLGAYIYGRKAGMLAAFMMATFSATVNYSRDYLLEFPATAFITLALYAFVRAAEFRHRRSCLVFGSLVGLSVLTKTMAGVFFIGPALLALGWLLRRRQLSRGVLVNALLSVGVGVLVAAVWWGPNVRTAFGYLMFYGFQQGSVPYSGGGSAIFTWKNLTYYALALTNHGSSFLYACLFVGLMLMRGMMQVSAVQRKPLEKIVPEPQAGYLWAWLVVGYVILTVVPNKGEERYAQPLLPPIALLMAGSIEAIGRLRVRRLVGGMVIAIGGFNYLGLTYGLPLIPQRLYTYPFAIISHEYPHYSWVRSTISRQPDASWTISAILAVLVQLYDERRAKVESNLRVRLADLASEATSREAVRLIYRSLVGREPRMREIEQYVAALRQGGLTHEGLIEILKTSGEFKDRRASVLVVPDHPLFNASTLRYYAEVDRLPLRFSHILDGPITLERLHVYEFVLDKQGGYQGPAFSTRYTDTIHAELRRTDSGFASLEDGFAFPDDSQIVIFAARSAQN